MKCTACGSEAAAGARFCAGCGARLPEPAPAPPPGQLQTIGSSSHQLQAAPGQSLNLNVNVNLPVHARRPVEEDYEPPPERALARRPGVFCPSCGQRTLPLPYFARGMNVAKAAVLFAIFPLAPLLLFLIRKDRVVCSNCKALLAGEVHIPLMETFSAAPRALARHQQETALAEKQLENEEIAHLERRSRKRQGKAWTYGVAATMLAGVGVTAIGDGPEQLFFALSGLSGVGAVVNGRRSRKDGLEAQAKRQRQRVLEILGLARQHQGRLTVTLVASHMQIDFREAEALLDSMVDGRRVDVQVDDQGRISYVFPELHP